MKYKKTKLFTLIALSAYTAIMVYLMLFGFGRITHSDYLYNLVPFKTIRYPFEIYIQHNIWHYSIWNIFGNIGMFIPFGILLAILFDFKFIKSLIIFEIGLLMLEVAQLISRRGVFDIDDIILNTIGFLTGYAIISIIHKIINKFRRHK